MCFAHSLNNRCFWSFGKDIKEILDLEFLMETAAFIMKLNALGALFVGDRLGALWLLSSNSSLILWAGMVISM